MRAVLVLFLLIQFNLIDAVSQQQDQGFLQPVQKKIFNIKLKAETNQVKSPKQIFDFLTTSQTYERRNLGEFSEFGPPIDLTSIGFKTSNKNKKYLSKPIHLYNYKNTQYTGELAIGSEDNKFKVLFDTGSANLWIDSSRCQEDGCKNHKQYDGSKSSTYKPVGYALDVIFGTGELNGQVNSDNVWVGGIPIDTQDFAEIVQENGAVFQDSGFDGIVGLAYPSMGAYNFNPLFDNIIKQEKLQNNQFAFYLNSKEGAQESVLTFGGYDDAFMDGPVHYHRVIDKYYWMIKAENILVNGKDVGLCPAHGCKLIADTGTSLITGPTDDLLKLLDMADVNDKCTNIADLPTIEFIIDKISYKLDPQDYTMQMFDNGVESPVSQASVSSFVETGSQQCIGAFMPLDIEEPQGPAWILGDVFLNKFYSIYDRDTNMVGFAKAKQ